MKQRAYKPHHVWSPGKGPYFTDNPEIENVCDRCGLRSKFFRSAKGRPCALRWFWHEIEAGVWAWVAVFSPYGWTPRCIGAQA